ncbi:structural maintenance of chromosomes protein 5-like [Ptychodera flava]|uniref:structural maintenance of chromosomes protein 5-like n=1 Tax=Ptychodera flava TaxID=63121 RepID=UPI00396A7A70
MGEEDNVKPELDEIARNCKDIYNKIQLIDTEIEMLAKDRSDFKKAIKSHRDELKKLSDLKDQRLRALKQRNKDTYNAVEWLRANKHMFKATIHEPMALVIDMLNRQHAKYIEMHISGNDLRAFVCEDAEDMEKFLAEVRDKQNLRVNAVKSPRQAPSEYQPQRPIEELRRWGFECYLRDLFEAPDAVMAYLCKQYRVHDVPLGNDKTQKHVSRVIAESGQRTFYTPEYQYVVRRSKYGNKTTSSRSTAVGAAQLLYVSIDPNQTRELEQQLQEAENRLRQGEEKFLRLKRDRQTLSEEDNAWRERKKELQKKRDRRRTVVQNIKAKHDSIAKSESEALDLQREEHKAEQEIAKINKKKMTVVLQLKNAIQSCLEANKHKVRIALVVALVFAEKNRMEGQFREGNQLQQTLKAEHGRLSELKSQAKDKARRLLNIAKERSKLGQNEDIPPALKEVFDRFPSTIEEIDDMIHNEKARADCVFETNREVVDDYNNRKKEIAKLSSEVEKKRQLVERHQQEIAEVKDKWLAPLQELMAQISDRFSYFFKCLGCAGEVDLYKGEMRRITTSMAYALG